MRAFSADLALCLGALCPDGHLPFAFQAFARIRLVLAGTLPKGTTANAFRAIDLTACNLNVPSLRLPNRHG